jgi:hypothetical protein
VAGNVTVLKGLSWNPAALVKIPDLPGVLDNLRVDFTAELDPGKFKQFGASAVQVFVCPGTDASPMLHPAFKAGVSANQLSVSVQLGQSRQVLTELGGFVLLDVDCDYLLDTANVPVSSSQAAITGADQPAIPGGLMRLTLRVLRG